LSAHAASLHAASLHAASLQAAVPYAADAHAASLHAASLQAALDHAALDHAASLQAAASHAVFAFAAEAHAAALNTFVTPSAAVVMNWSRPAFGFGSAAFALSDRAAGMFSSPTPSEPFGADGTGDAVIISAPLSWSGVQFGFLLSSIAAAPATIGAENDVPLSCMYPGATTSLARVNGRVAFAGTGPTMYRPGPAMSGFEKPSGV
jgi:hypothetical protein